MWRPAGRKRAPARCLASTNGTPMIDTSSMTRTSGTEIRLTDWILPLRRAQPPVGGGVRNRVDVVGGQTPDLTATAGMRKYAGVRWPVNSAAIAAAESGQLALRGGTATHHRARTSTSVATKIGPT